ncbi:MAG: SapC family protein [Gammaproteobacteria bacterium]|nr:SapC family protein [Gammaproteobacteria bacterium]
MNQNNAGNRLFGEQGEHSRYLEAVLTFLKNYQTDFNRTRTLCDKLNELKLLEPMQAQVKLQNGKQLSLTGFRTANREKLNNLAPENLSELAKSGVLELLYVHLSSLVNFSTVIERIMKDETKQNLADMSSTGDSLLH